MMAIIEICNSGSFYCSKLLIRLQLRLPGYTFPQYLFAHQLTYLSMIKGKEKSISLLFFIHQVTIERVFVFKNIMLDWLEYSPHRLDRRS